MTTKRVITLLAGVSAWACNGDGTQPAGPPFDLLKSGGDAQNWYFNNPLPTPISATAADASRPAVPRGPGTWPRPSGLGAVSPLRSTTNASGVATTTDSVGSSTTRQTINATFTGLLSPASFTEFASSPPTTVDVSVTSFAFTPRDTIVQAGGVGAWTRNSGTTQHNVSYEIGRAHL